MEYNIRAHVPFNLLNDLRTLKSCFCRQNAKIVLRRYGRHYDRNQTEFSAQTSTGPWAKPERWVFEQHPRALQMFS